MLKYTTKIAANACMKNDGVRGKMLWNFFLFCLIEILDFPWKWIKNVV